jgi:hypothetical protein
VNTAARIENLGLPNMIHISKETANLLIAAGKTDWVKQREGLTSAKGKGMLQTYWLTIPSGRSPISKTIPQRILLLNLRYPIQKNTIGLILTKKLNELRG